MKAELIAEYRLRIKDRTLITLPVTAIERILEERDKLLEALRVAELELSIHRLDGDEPSSLDLCRATIAYVESE